MVLKIFLTGGSGTLGKELIEQSKAHEIDFISPSSRECDIRDYDSVLRNMSSFEDNIVLHAASLTNTKQIETDPSEAIEVNVIGTLNVLRACKELKKKMIYISTDYVFDGNKGLYETTDPINPIGKYSKTKAAAELIVRTYENSLVIRTSFFGKTFPYDEAFADIWSSKDYVDLIVPKIISSIKNGCVGVCHIGTSRRSIYDIAIKRRPDVRKAYNQKLNNIIPRDTSFVGDKT